ncbi:MAG: two-component system response regulator [Bacteroidetes bacterium 43-93]|nr:response regulator transcription factor [Bacteroidota bacterium]OJW97484.1 MAG: two-component system response regulator [Bacteroidetes bacterium 43-93]
MMSKKILYIEDEPFLAKIVKETLELKEYRVLHQTDGSGITDTVNSFEPDICILDVMLPNIDGYTLGSKIRSVYPRLPIIFLTAKTQTEDVVKGFSSGGTDYLKKPFSMEELIVRIENQLKLYGAPEAATLPAGDKIALGNITFYPNKFELVTPVANIKLSNRESQILGILCSNANQVVDRRKLLQLVWGDDSFFNSRNLDVYIRKLRDHLSAEPRIEIITLKGTGYHFSVPV